MKNYEQSEDRLELAWLEEMRIDDITRRINDRHRGHNQCWDEFYNYPPFPPVSRFAPRRFFWDHFNEVKDSTWARMTLCVEPHEVRFLVIKSQRAVEYKHIQALSAEMVSEP